MELQGQADPKPKLGFGNCQWLFPLDAPGEKLLEEPAYESKKPVYYAARYGDAEDDVHTFVVDESEGTGKGYDVVYVDANNDNRIDAAEERFEFSLGSRVHVDPIRIEILVTAGGVTAPYYVTFSAFPYSGKKHPVENIHANLRNSSYYGGEALLEGKRRKIAILDLDSNGRFNDPEQALFDGDRFFVDLDDDGSLRDNSQLKESFPYGGYTRIAGTWYSIVVSPDGSQVTIARAQPPLGKVEASARISRAGLVSPAQSLELNFTDGLGEAVAGTYRVRWVRLLAQGEPHNGWGLSGKFDDDAPRLKVSEGEEVRLVAGSPLTVQAQAVPKGDDGTLEFSLLITGASGETYRWRKRNASAPKAGFEIVDASDGQIASEEFDYG